MRVRSTLLIAGLLVLILLGVVPVYAQEGDQGGDPENGAQLFAENCVACHGERGEGRIGATLNDAFAAIDVDTFIVETVRRGRPGTFMPAFSEAFGGPLSDAEIEDIAAYIESWGMAHEPPVPAPPRPVVEIPPLPEVDGDPNAGYTIYQQDCAVCHGKDGYGRIGANLKTAFPAIERETYTITTISNGVSGSLMPAFAQASGGPLTEQQVNDVAAYVLSIQQEATSQPDEIVGKGSALPLMAVGLLGVVFIVAMGIALQRREDESE